MASEPEVAATLASKPKAALVSVGINLFLISIKVAAAVLTGSIGILAEAAHSSLDLTASVLAFWGIRLASKPADEHHAFGHEKFENISSLAQMILLVATCVWILFESGSRLLLGFEINVTWYAFVIMGISVVVDALTSNYLRRTASRAGGSPALEADSLHFSSDMWGAVAVLVGLAAAALGFTIADPIAAIVVAIIIGGTAIKSGFITTNILLDRAPDEHLLREVGKVISSHPDILSFHALRARQAGNKVFLDVRIVLDPATSLERSHYLSHSVADEIRRQVPEVKDAVVHAEPALPRKKLPSREAPDR
jgi:cation diffusion facilitator family transporter